MAQVILFGGGDGGGLIITASGVRPIPPFDPALRLQLRSVSALLRAERLIPPDEARRQIGSLVNKLTNLAVGQVEGVIGELDAQFGIVYQDDDGGFTCGSTGKPPIPFPWPPAPLPGVDDLVRRGVLAEEVLEFARLAANAGADLSNLFRDPAAEASRLGIELPERAERQLKELSIADPEKLEDPVDREIVEFFHKAVKDGRHLDAWATRPFDVARALDVELSSAAAERIVGASGIRFGGRDPNVALSPVAVAIVVVIVIVVWNRERRVPVIDESGIEKF